jgi:hypothetical protein
MKESDHAQEDLPPPEEIIAKLRQTEVLLGEGKKVPVVVKGETIGYLKRDVAALYSPALMRTWPPS